MIFYLILVAALIFLLLFGATAAGLLLTLRKHYKTAFALALVWGMGIGIALSSGLSGRNLHLSSEELAGYAIGGSTFAGFIGTRLIQAFVLGVALLQLVNWAISPGRKGKSTALLWIVFFVYFVGALILPAFYGTGKGFQFSYIYPLLLASALFVQEQIEVDRLIYHVKLVIGLSILVGFMLIPIKPNLVLEHPYTAPFAISHFRFWGLAPHANAQGPLALFLLMLAYAYPQPQKWLNRAYFLLGFAAFVLAQSKTAWMDALLVIFLLTFRKAWLDFRSPDNTSLLSLPQITLFLFFVLAAALMLAGSFDAIPSPMALLSSSEQTGIETLSGRDVIWATALAEWDRNKLFGYGPTIWDLGYRLSVHLPFAFHAHNQFIDTLSMSGLVGFVPLMIYLLVLGHYAIRFSKISNGFTLILFVMMFFRCFSEPFFRIKELFDVNLFIHMIFLAMLVYYARTEKTDLIKPSSRLIGNLTDRR
jgi:O-antigen ligase